ncbi:DNA-binding transcription factor [Lithospermum erythrorhizon]|uniref:DNA-binding transcription factor n=1 Tax=Lithospermum erythrorhizon TaxID=34254 RepID=A0AAV3Q0E7_LITER
MSACRGPLEFIFDNNVYILSSTETTRLKWQKIDAGLPTARFGHSCVVIGDRLVLFGGINDKGICQNDTWVGDIQMQDINSITLSWRLLDVGSNAPRPCGAHAACCIGNSKMLIHGGIGLSGLRLGDTWILNLSENLTFGSWQEIVTNSSSSSRSGHSLTHLGGTRTVLFGGRAIGYQVLSDLWLFDTSEDHWRWIHLSFEPQDVPHGFSLPPVGHSVTLILGGRLLIYEEKIHTGTGKMIFGCWTSVQYHQQQCNLLLSGKKKSSTKCGEDLKFKAIGQTLLYLFRGMVDGLLQPAEASGLQFDGGLFLVELLHC